MLGHMVGQWYVGNDNNKPIESCPASHVSALLLRQWLLSHLASDTGGLVSPTLVITNPCGLILVWQ